MRGVEPRSGLRLQRYLSRAGVASRRQGERLIADGRVSVDGVVVTELGARVTPGRHVVRIDGVRVDLQPARWIASYKPGGYLTSRKDIRGRPTVYAVLPDALKDLFHVGRLDRLTEGLLIFTNDGEAAHRLLHPSFEIPRRYVAEVAGPVGPAEVRRLERGVRLEDGIARAEEVEVQAAQQGRDGQVVASEMRLTLREGRKREVRRMLAAVDLRVRRLVRTSFGPIELGSMSPGEHRELSAAEVTALRAAVGLREYDGDT